MEDQQCNAFLSVQRLFLPIARILPAYRGGQATGLEVELTRYILSSVALLPASQWTTRQPLEALLVHKRR